MLNRKIKFGETYKIALILNCKKSGGASGGGEVNKLFIDFLEKFFTKENIQQIKRERYSEWMKINKKFEKIKRSIELTPTMIMFLLRQLVVLGIESISTNYQMKIKKE